MDTRTVTAAGLARDALRRARERGLDHHFAFVLLPWYDRPESPHRGASYVGVVTAGGTSMPLTRALCEALEHVTADADGHAIAIRLPCAEDGAGPRDPIFSVLYAAPITDRQTLCGLAGPDELAGAPLVLTCPRRPDGWPR